ncbi:MAG: four helix bundle protein [Bacteroidetes bacterium]|nr:four helix bundle protein [Bacteroidota bacterium]
MGFKFEQLIVWQEAMSLGEDVYRLSRKFPKEEIFGLTSQITRATDSIALNISEGSMGQTDGENGRFIGYAIRSCAEVITCLYKARNRKYVTEGDFSLLYEKVEILFKRLNRYRGAIR